MQAQKPQKKDFRKDFEAFKNKAKQEYTDFRKKAFAEYLQFVREAWEEFGAEPPVQVPEDEKVEPMVVEGFEEETASWFSKLFGGKDKSDEEKAAEKKAKKAAKEAAKAERKRKKREQSNDNIQVQQVVEAPKAPLPQAKPLSEVVQQTAQANPYMTFDVFGTQCRVRIGDNCRFRLAGITGDQVADALGEFLKPQFDNLLYDCLQERQKHNFSDWAYYQMLLTLTNKFYGNHSNEATLALGFLYSQSGYKMRYAHDGQTLYMIVASQYNMFGKSYFYIDGGVPLKQRTEMVDAFQRGERPIFLISLKAGGLGLNLTQANYVFHLDPWWNPAIEQQATDRTYRIGQNRAVTVYHLVSKNTIEEKIIRLHQTKRDLAENILAGTDSSYKLTGKDLLEMVAQ